MGCRKTLVDVGFQRISEDRRRTAIVKDARKRERDETGSSKESGNVKSAASVVCNKSLSVGDGGGTIWDEELDEESDGMPPLVLEDAVGIEGRASVIAGGIVKLKPSSSISKLATMSYICGGSSSISGNNGVPSKAKEGSSSKSAFGP